MIYRRTITPFLESELSTKETTVITGMRQVGKTTLLTYLFSKITSSNKVLLDFENPLHRKIFEEKNYDMVWNNLAAFGLTNKEKAYILLDEIQNLPQISNVIKYLYDHYDVKFIVTGSSSYYLKNLFPESQAGRKLVFEIFPLTFNEFLIFKEISRVNFSLFKEKALNKNPISYEQLIPLYREYIEFGGFPKVVLETSVERKKKLLNEIFTSYFEHDVKSLSDIKDLGKLRDLILLLIPRVGSKIEIGKIASVLSLSRETIYNYLSFLEFTYFIKLIPKYSVSIDRQAAGSKKLYLCDSGMANFLGKTSQGQLFEQSVFQNIRDGNTLCYYSKKKGAEIDFIVNGKIALEVKMMSSKQDIEFLKRRSLGLHLTEKYTVSLEYSSDQEMIPATNL